MYKRFYFLFIISSLVGSLHIKAQPTFTQEHIIIDDSNHEVYPTIAITGDLDGDQDEDVVVYSGNGPVDSKITWYENLGNGNFSNQTIIADDLKNVYSIFLSDLDSDGDLDLLFPSWYYDQDNNLIAWCENNGDGQFSEVKAIYSGLERSEIAISSDVDNDGNIDVIAGFNLSDEVVWFKNLGNGIFGQAQTISNVVNNPIALHAIDIENDGDLDIISGSNYDGKIHLHNNSGTQTFVDQRINFDASIFSPKSIQAIDLDFDTDLDIIVAGGDGSGLHIYENDGLNSFTNISLSFEDNLQYNVDLTIPEDMDLDGDLDLVIIHSNRDHVVWIENLGSLNFYNKHTIVEKAYDPRSIVISDIDGDNTRDIVLTAHGSQQVGWHPNNGNGSFDRLKVISASANVPTDLFAIDLDQDGDIDVVSASNNDSKIAWHQNNGNGNFGNQEIIAINVSGANSLFVDDIDLDNDLDIIASAPYEEGGLTWIDNDGSNHNWQERTIASPGGVTSVFGADLDGDNDIDALSTSQDGVVAYYEYIGGSSSSNFGPANVLITDDIIFSSGAYSVKSADIDFDGDNDIVSTSLINNLSWFENDGDGNFSAPKPIVGNNNRVSLFEITDFNNDNYLDIVGFSSTNNNLIWFENNGNGGFSTAIEIEDSISLIEDLASEDLDNDGDNDILAALYDENLITWYENTGSGNFSNRKIVTNNVDGPMIVETKDFDGDGDFDVLTGSKNDQKIAWFSNSFTACDAVYRDTIYSTTCFINEVNTSSDTLTTILGCDSIVTSIISLNPDGEIDVNISEIDNYLSANELYATYQWLDCNNNFTVISGMTNQIFEPTTNGSYAVELTNGSCIDTSDCFDFLITHLTIFEEEYNVNIYPNPIHHRSIFKISPTPTFDYHLVLFDVLGNEMKKYYSNASNSLLIKREELPSGLYFLNLYTNDNQKQLASFKLTFH